LTCQEIPDCAIFAAVEKSLGEVRRDQGKGVFRRKFRPRRVLGFTSRTKAAQSGNS